MSEYWKSTPKYWCKHCKTFVRDSKLEKQNHEATPKHQGNLQRFLRDLHRNNEREEREKQRGKDEVARLKGLPKDALDPINARHGMRSAVSASSDNRQATATDRKKQIQQLAEMGVAVPEEARREMAMAGDWQIKSVTPIYEKSEAVQKVEDIEANKTAALAVGIRKRKFEGDEEKEEAGERFVKRGWGLTTRTWQSDDNGSLDALLNATKTMKPNRNEPSRDLLSEGLSIKVCPGKQSPTDPEEALHDMTVKREVDSPALVLAEQSSVPVILTDSVMKAERDMGEPNILFKKRKSKQLRQKE